MSSYSPSVTCGPATHACCHSTVLLLLFALIHAIVAKLGLVKTIGADRRRIPFAPVVAAALIGTFMLGCLDQPPAALWSEQNAFHAISRICKMASGFLLQYANEGTNTRPRQNVIDLRAGTC